MAQVTFRDGERVLLRVRKHPVMIAVPIAVAVVLLALALFLSRPLFSFGAVGVILFLLLCLGATALAVRSLVLWSSTVFLLTDQRVIDVDRTGLFRWAVSDANFNNLEDVSYETAGPLQALCRSGNLTVTTVSGATTLRVHFVPDPGTVREAVIAARGRARREERAMSDEGQRSPASSAPDGGLDPEDDRAVRRYAEHLSSRRAMKSFLKDDE